jgi:restriction system protein
MTVPDYQSLMLPVLKRFEKGEARIGDVIEELSNTLALTDEDRAEMVPSGKQTTFANRVHWAKTYLKQAGLLETTRRAHFRITPRGQEVLSQNPSRIDINFLARFPEFIQFRERTSDNGELEKPVDQQPQTLEGSKSTPDDELRNAHRLINEALGQDLLDRVMKGTPAFFEKLIVTLLLAMGYGGTVANAGRTLGRSGDDGVDGVVDQDPLGLDRVYIQAKRYQAQNSIGPNAIREFFGSLDMHNASKGIFVTTSAFSPAARETTERLGKRIVLIDGRLLAQLMIRYGVGCRTEDTLEVKRLDEEFFE